MHKKRMGFWKSFAWAIKYGEWLDWIDGAWCEHRSCYLTLLHIFTPSLLFCESFFVLGHKIDQMHLSCSHLHFCVFQTRKIVDCQSFLYLILSDVFSVMKQKHFFCIIPFWFANELMICAQISLFFCVRLLVVQPRFWNGILCKFFSLSLIFIGTKTIVHSFSTVYVRVYTLNSIPFNKSNCFKWYYAIWQIMRLKSHSMFNAFV